MADQETNRRSLDGRIALITGGSRGIGRAIAFELARRGARIAINFLHSQDQAIATAEEVAELGTDVMVVKADIASRDDIHNMVEAVEQRFGGLDIVVSNAAAGGFRELDAIRPTGFDAIMRHNAAPVVWLAQAAAGLLADGPQHGKLVALSSHGSIRTVPHYGVIGASKAALESLVRHLALEYGPRGINFNCVLPGIVATEAIASLPNADALLDGAGKRMLIPEDRLREDAIAPTVAFLCESGSDMIQGQTLIVDGGVSIQI